MNVKINMGNVQGTSWRVDELTHTGAVSDHTGVHIVITPEPRDKTKWVADLSIHRGPTTQIGYGLTTSNADDLEKMGVALLDAADALREKQS